LLVGRRRLQAPAVIGTNTRRRVNMHAMKFAVAAAAALVVGTAGAETMQGSSVNWSDDARGSISSQSAQSSHSTFASEAYDGKQFGGWVDTSSGAYGRSFSEPTMSQDQPMMSSGARSSLSDGTRLNHFHGG
jgi:hypothetical protein